MAETTSHDTAGSVSGGLRTLLRLEGLALLALMTAAYAVLGESWWIYAVLFLAPDLSFAAYLAGPRAGAFVYNAAHSTIGPIMLAAAGFALGPALVFSIAMIWLAHIGLDRALGYGLKYSSGFGFTHLGRIGKQAAENLEARLKAISRRP